MIKVLKQSACPTPSNKLIRCQFSEPLKLNSILSSSFLLHLSNTSSNLSSSASLKCFCTKDENTHQVSSQSFSALAEDNIPWDSGDVWTTTAFYMFSLHIPLSFGWMSVAAQILQQPNLDPQTEAIALLIAQIIEVVASFLLLQFTAKPPYKFTNFFGGYKSSAERNYLLASAIGFGFLLALVFFTSVLVDGVIEPKMVNNPVLKEILVSSNISKAACVLVYCVVTPLLEENVYRGFLLRSLSSTMKWQQAVLVSSAIFSAAHLSGENFLQLFIIGCILGCSYCWTGNLCSSFLIHSLYNALTLAITLLS
ncbi:uncharacterized protein LOC21394830 [Morus notabilis]|uniref:uncharacterized protein LOC21394830 n=1 Tax=Morus notabilis TaxID=981085 RepID=UPI000CED1DAD|nr:uncharacterized protein LOC21394830 [Morus notabilis]